VEGIGGGGLRSAVRCMVTRTVAEIGSWLEVGLVVKWREEEVEVV
jgi:hypothetical protein